MHQRSTSMQFAAQRVLHEFTVQRLVERIYEERIISNVERGAYVECMVELALRERQPAWRLTGPWAAWDIEHQETLARIEIKQSAALQSWSTKPDPRVLKSRGFSIKPHRGYYLADGEWIDTPLQRHADLYVFGLP